MIPRSEWEWFGSPGHFICSHDCRFHLCTRVGSVLVSTVGQYFPDEGVRDIIASSRGITLRGKGDARRADYLRQVGYEEIGYGRTYETMVFALSGARCTAPACGCDLPMIIPNELEARGYNDAGAATRGHRELCAAWATEAKQQRATEEPRDDA